MPNFFELLQNAIKDVASGEPPAPKCIADALDDIRSLSSVVFDFTDPNSIARWFEKWRALIADVEVRETILVRILQQKLPRVAEALTLLGIIEFTGFEEFAPDPANPGLKSVRPLAFKIHWQSEPGQPHSSVADFFNSGAVSQPETWLRFLVSRLGGTPDDARESIKFMKVLFGIGLVSPQELLKLEYRQLGFTALPRQDPVGNSEVDLLELLDRVNSPFVLPLQTLNPNATLSQMVASGADTGFSLVVDGQDDPPNTLAGLAALSLGLKVNDVQSQLVNSKVVLSSNWTASFQCHDSGSQSFVVKLAPDGRLQVEVPESLRLTITRESSGPAGLPALVIGQLDKSHLSIGKTVAEVSLNRQDLSLSEKNRASPVSVAFRASPLELVLSSADLAGPLIGVKPPEIRLSADLALTLDSKDGVSLGELGWSYSKFVALGIELGPLKIPRGNIEVSIKLNPASTGLDIVTKLRLTAEVKLGPISLSLENAGVQLRFRPAEPTAFDTSGLPPNGISIAVDAAPISGGGFIIRSADNEFAGGLSLKLLGFGISAYGIYKDLQGEPSFIAIIGIRFPMPGIQLSWGFALSGVGGLVGVNRRANIGLLGQSLASGATGNVLFNDNPAANAGALVNDLRAFFPEARGVFLIGPTLQITWGVTLVSMDLGLFIELPGPRGIYLIGSVRIMVGANAEIAVVYLRMDFVGGIDLTAKLIRFDASLVNSHVLQIFRLTGGVALRISYGSDGFFLLTIGGFHPAFHPTDMQLPQVARAGAYLSVNVGVKVWLKMESYFAITPNTLQIGSGVEAGLEIGPLEAHGWFRFDALIQFKPFHFDARIDAGFDVSFEGVSFCGVRVQGMMSGPGPIVISARATVSLLLVDVSGDVTVTLGSDSGDRLVTIADLLDYLAPKYADASNYSIHGQGEDAMVVVRPRKDLGASSLISPVGTIVWDQRLLPMLRNIQRFDGQDLQRESRIEIVADNALGTITGEFSAITYSRMSDSAVLNHSRFTREQSGLILGSQQQLLAAKTTYTPTMNVRKITGPKLERFAVVGSLLGWSGALEGFRQERRSYRRPEALRDGPVAEGKFPRPAIRPDRWKTVGSKDDRQNVSDGQAFALTRSQGGMAIHATDRTANLSSLGI